MMSLLHHPSRGTLPSHSSRSPSPLKTLPRKHSCVYLALCRWHLALYCSAAWRDNRTEEALEEHFFVLWVIWWRCYRRPYGISLSPKGIMWLIPQCELSEGWPFTFCPTQWLTHPRLTTWQYFLKMNYTVSPSVHDQHTRNNKANTGSIIILILLNNILLSHAFIETSAAIVIIRCRKVIGYGRKPNGVTNFHWDRGSWNVLRWL